MSIITTISGAIMNTLINQVSNFKYPQSQKYQNLSFQSRNNHRATNVDDNSTRNILISSLIALSSFVAPSINANTNSQINTNIDNIEIVTDNVKAKSALDMNLSITPNKNVYLDNKTNTYYHWNDEKQKFKKFKNIDSVLKTGYIKTKKGSYLDPECNMFIENVKGKILCPTKDSRYNLPSEMAKVFGYQRTSISHLNVFYDKENEQYLKWNNEAQTWNNTKITDVSPNGNFISDGKAYRALQSGKKEISKKEFYADKQNLFQTDIDTIYADKDVFSDKGYFVWHKDTEEFEEFGSPIERKKMLSQKVDGKVDDFIQGSVGDCWLLSAINGLKMNPKGRKILEKSLSVDDNDNITVTLQGPKQQYTFSKEQLDSILNLKNYYYSTGDRDVLAIEMAIEMFKSEITNQDSRITNMYNYYIPPQIKEEPLEGGQTYNSLHLLTGMQSNRIFKTYAPNVILTNNVATVGQLDEKKIQKLLDNPNNIVLAGYKTGNNSGHAVVLCSMDKDNVYLIDSDLALDNPDRKIKQTKMNKKEFFDNLIDVTYTDLSKPITEKQSKPENIMIHTTEAARQIIGGDLYM